MYIIRQEQFFLIGSLYLSAQAISDALQQSGVLMAAGIAVGLACGLSATLAYAMAPALMVTRATPVRW